MGKSFKTELELLNHTFHQVLNCDVKKIERFLSNSIDNSLLIVGSGGSYSAARAFDYFSQRTMLNKLSKAITPFELFNYNESLKGSNVVLLTAGGNNPDTVNSFKYISQFEPKSFLTICLSKKSKIHTLSSKFERNSLFEIDNSSGKDGFLAVNSLISMMSLVSKAYGNVTGDNFFDLNNDFGFNIPAFTSDINNVLSKKTIIVLHGGLSTSVAIDLESKFTEAALGNIQLADYRNFAHGRHHWIAKHYNDTSIIALVSPKEEIIANKTLSLIPLDIPVCKLCTQKDSFLGMLELFYQAFAIVDLAGKLVNIDPGNPRVPEFGRKLYHLSFTPPINKKVKALTLQENRAAYKKSGSVCGDLFTKYKLGFNKFYNTLKETTFNGLIFDYDGTIKDKNKDSDIEDEIFNRLNLLLDNGIIIGIATGRGQSVRKELQEKIHKRHWKNVLIAYYNGGEIGFLDNNEMPNKNVETYQSLSLLYNDITNMLGMSDNIELRPYQLTIMQTTYNSEVIKNIVLDMCLKYSDLKYFESGHSIDIIPKVNSKIKIIPHFNENPNFLCVGDSGQINGNDYELLSHQFGISVKNVSPSISTCWNFAPVGTEGPSATLYYLNLIEVTIEGSFSFKG